MKRPAARIAGLLLAVLLLSFPVHADFTFVQVSDTHIGVKEAGYNAS
jgi:hypothetical protein